MIYRKQGKAISAEPLSQTKWKCQVVVVGSGAGGAVVARELAEQGVDVILIEEGQYYRAEDFTGDPLEMTTKMYRDAGMTTTVGMPAIVLPLGKTVGGTTTINSATCFRTPPAVLEKWQKDFGLDDLTEKNLEPYFEKIEKNICAAPGRANVQSKSAEKLALGARKLGLEAKPLSRNAKGCEGLGVCAFGCPSGAKQSMDVSYVPRALDAGCTLISSCKATALILKLNQARGVKAVCNYNGQVSEIEIEAQKVVLAMGAIGTPFFLKKQRLPDSSGWLGKNLSIHPASRVAAVFDERLDSWQGIPQGLYIDAFKDEGIMFEGIFVPPALAAMTFSQYGEKHKRIMADYPNMAMFGIMVSDTSRGQVRTFGDMPLIQYNMNDKDVRAFQKGTVILSEIFFAAGARKTLTTIHKFEELNSLSDVKALAKARIKNQHIDAMAFHPLGTSRMSAFQARGKDSGVIDPDMRFYSIADLYIADGSAVPTSLGVNPQVTIMALAARLADHIASRL